MKHEHRFDLRLGMDGHGQIYGDFEGYVRQCKCGEYAPDVLAFIERRKKRDTQPVAPQS